MTAFDAVGGPEFQWTQTFIHSKIFSILRMKQLCGMTESVRRCHRPCKSTEGGPLRRQIRWIIQFLIPRHRLTASCSSPEDQPTSRSTLDQKIPPSFFYICTFVKSSCTILHKTISSSSEELYIFGFGSVRIGRSRRTQIDENGGRGRALPTSVFVNLRPNGSSDRIAFKRH